MMPLSSQNNFDCVRSPLMKPSVAVEELSIDGACGIDALWRDLYLNCAEPNPCYAPDYVAKVFSLSKTNKKAKILVMKLTAGSEPEKLIGLLPLGLDFRFFHFHAPIFKAQHSCFSGSSLPLIRKGFEEIALSAFLNWLSTKISVNGLFVFKELPMNGPVGRALIDLLRERQIPWLCNQPIERPMVDVSEAENFEDYSKLLKGRTKQTLKRKKRQLSKLGELSFSCHMKTDLSDAMREFCDLEVRGWKGREGTAMLLDPKGKSLAFETLSSTRFGQTRIEALRLDGKAIAMNIFIGVEGSSLLFKPTYDEAYAKYSPGSLLHYETVRQLFKEKWTQRIDSAVLPTDQLRSIWRQKQLVGNIIFGFSQLTPDASILFADSILKLKSKLQNLI